MTDDTAEEDAMAEVVPADSPARKAITEGLSYAQEDHLLSISTRHGHLVGDKYIKGQREHGGDMWKKPGMLKHLGEEVADQTSYYWTIVDQVQSVARRLRAGEITPEQAADEMEGWLA